MCVLKSKEENEDAGTNFYNLLRDAMGGDAAAAASVADDASAPVWLLWWRMVAVE